MTGLYLKDFGWRRLHRRRRRRRRQCIGENKGLNQIHAADWNPTHNCRQPYNQEKILSLAILINIFSKINRSSTFLFFFQLRVQNENSVKILWNDFFKKWMEAMLN